MVNAEVQRGEGHPTGGPGGAGHRLNLLLSAAPGIADAWADRLPPLLDPLGIRSLRASSAAQATRVIGSSSVHIAVVDLSLPLEERESDPAESEEAGIRLLVLLTRQAAPPPTVVVKRSRTHRDDCREVSAALRAGAFAVIDRPRAQGDIELLLEVLRRCVRRHYRDRWPGQG